MGRSVESESLVGIYEITKIFHVERSSVYYWIGRPTFPDPVADLMMGRVWDLEDVRKWRTEFVRKS